MAIILIGMENNDTGGSGVDQVQSVSLDISSLRGVAGFRVVGIDAIIHSRSTSLGQEGRPTSLSFWKFQLITGEAPTLNNGLDMLYPWDSRIISDMEDPFTTTSAAFTSTGTYPQAVTRQDAYAGNVISLLAFYQKSSSTNQLGMYVRITYELETLTIREQILLG